MQFSVFTEIPLSSCYDALCLRTFPLGMQISLEYNNIGPNIVRQFLEKIKLIDELYFFTTSDVLPSSGERTLIFFDTKNIKIIPSIDEAVNILVTGGKLCTNVKDGEWTEWRILFGKAWIEAIDQSQLSQDEQKEQQQTYSQAYY